PSPTTSARPGHRPSDTHQNHRPAPRMPHASSARQLPFTKGGTVKRPAHRPAPRRLIELSHHIRHGMITYRGLPGPELREYLPRAASTARYGPGTESPIGHVSMVANTGTCLDSPFHRFADGTDVARLPLHSVADLDGVVVRIDAAPRAIDRDALAAYD